MSRIDSIHMVRDVVARGEYCSVLPHTFVRDDLDAGVLGAVRAVLERTLVAMTRMGRNSPPAARAVVDMARPRLGELAELRQQARSGS